MAIFGIYVRFLGCNHPILGISISPTQDFHFDAGEELIEQLMRSALANPGSAVAAQGFLSVPGILQSQELTSLQQQGVVVVKWFSGNLVLIFFFGWKNADV